MKHQPDTNEIYYVVNIETEDTGLRNERPEFRTNVSSAETSLDVDVKGNQVEENYMTKKSKNTGKTRKEE